MASLDSYIKDRDERIKNGSLVYSGTASKSTKTDFHKLNCETFKHNNGTYPDKTKFYF